MIAVIGLSVAMPLLFILMMAGPASLLGKKLQLKAVEQLVIGLAGALIILGICLLVGAAVGYFAVVTWGALCAGGLITVHQRRRLLIWARDPIVRSACGGWLLLLVVVTLYNWAIITFSGGGWSGDWLEHFERSRLPLLGTHPSQVLFIGFIPYPSRPPMINLLCGMFLQIFGDGFYVYQLASSLLGSLAFFGGVLFLGLSDVQVTSRRISVFTALFCLNPLIMQNLTYPWTKMATGFFVLCGLFVYREWVKRRQIEFLGVSVALMAGASTCHYSALVASVFPAAHLAWMIARGRLLNVRICIALAAGGLPMIVWLTICVIQLGWFQTFATNSSVSDRDLSQPALWFSNFVQNVWSSIVPFWFRPLQQYPLFQSFSSWLELAFILRNRFFLVYQTNLTFGLGIVGGFVVWSLALRALLSKPIEGGREITVFWAGLTASVVLIGAFAHANPDVFGVGHISGQPLILLGLACLARNLEHLSRIDRRWGVAIVGLLGLGWLVDLGFGVGLHGLIQACSPVDCQFPRDFDSGPVLWYNWQVKIGAGLRFVGDLVTVENSVVMGVVVGLLTIVWVRLMRTLIGCIHKNSVLDGGS